MGHNYIGHNCIGHDYIGPNYIGHKCLVQVVDGLVHLHGGKELRRACRGG